MTWIILTVLFAVIFWGGIAAFLIGRNKLREHETALAAWNEDPSKRGPYAEPPQTDAPLWKMGGMAVAASSVLLWIVVTGLASMHQIGERQVGIAYNFSGTIAGDLDKGWGFHAPWQHVAKENVGIQHAEWEFTQNNSAVSFDQQQIFGKLSVNYQIDKANVVDLYRRVGASWKEIIVNARVPQVFKETTATYATPDITAKREQLRRETKERLTSELAPYDIKVVDVFVTNLGFSQSYTDSIEAKQKQVQDALRQEAKIREAKAIGDQKVATAERDAQANIARARGEATANRLRQQSLTPLLVQQQAVEKLNPNVSVIICPPSSVCVPNSVVPAPAQP